MDVALGNKPFEIRKNDRDYKTGDFLLLMNYDAEKNEYVNGHALCEVTYMLKDAKAFGLMDGYVIIGIKILSKKY